MMKYEESHKLQETDTTQGQTNSKQPCLSNHFLPTEKLRTSFVERYDKCKQKNIKWFILVCFIQFAVMSILNTIKLYLYGSANGSTCSFSKIIFFRILKLTSVCVSTRAYFLRAELVGANTVHDSQASREKNRFMFWNKKFNYLSFNQVAT